MIQGEGTIVISVISHIILVLEGYLVTRISAYRGWGRVTDLIAGTNLCLLILSILDGIIIAENKGDLSSCIDLFVCPYVSGCCFNLECR